MTRLAVIVSSTTFLSGAKQTKDESVCIVAAPAAEVRRDAAPEGLRLILSMREDARRDLGWCVAFLATGAPRPACGWVQFERLCDDVESVFLDRTTLSNLKGTSDGEA